MGITSQSNTGYLVRILEIKIPCNPLLNKFTNSRNYLFSALENRALFPYLQEYQCKTKNTQPQSFALGILIND